MAADTSTSATATGSFNVERWLKAITFSKFTAAFTGHHGHVSYERCINLSEEDVRAVGVSDDVNVQLFLTRVKELRKLSEEDAIKLLSSQNLSLYIACEDEDVKLAQQLITNGANVNWRNPLAGESTPLYVAAMIGNVDLLNMLIDAGGDVNIANENKATPVYAAAFTGHIGALNVLIRAKADVNAATEDKKTPVYVAAQNGHVEALSILISSGADFNAADKNKSTPVFEAASHGQIGTLSALISAGADFNAAYVNQITPTHIAAYKGHVDILRTLHSNGARLNTKDIWNMTPLDWAVKENHSSVVEFLKSISTTHSQSVARAQIGSKPTLPRILAFPFKTGVGNIVQKIAGCREIFGVLLLEDDDGSIISGIAAPNQSPSEITLAIIRHWIQGNGRQPISWDTFIDTVRKAGFFALADDIREGLGNLQ